MDIVSVKRTQIDGGAVSARQGYSLTATARAETAGLCRVGAGRARLHTCTALVCVRVCVVYMEICWSKLVTVSVGRLIIRL